MKYDIFATVHGQRGATGAPEEILLGSADAPADDWNEALEALCPGMKLQIDVVANDGKAIRLFLDVRVTAEQRRIAAEG